MPPRNVGGALLPPVANGLNGNASGASELGRAAVKRVEDFSYRVHEHVLSEKRITMQGAIYPNLAEAADHACLLKQDMFDAEEFRQDLAAALKAKGMSQSELAKLLGLPSQSAVSNILKAKRRVTPEEVAEIRAILGMSEGPPVRAIPQIGLASAGVWQEAVTMTPGIRFIPASLCGKRAFAVEIVGDSMDKLLPEGGWAVVDPDQRHLYAGKVYLIANGDEETTVKRFCGEPSRFEPVSNNDMHQPFVLDDQPFRVIGRIVSYGSEDGL